jgi:hypothetical protein
MPPNANTQTDRTPEVEPAIRHTVPWRLTSVAALPDARLHVVFVDGTNGEVHLKSFLASPAINGTVFEALRDPAIFARAQVVLGGSPVAQRSRLGTRYHVRCYP